MLWILTALVLAPQTPEVLWQIGQAGNGWREMAIAGDYPAYARRFPRDVRYVVGESAAERDWPFVQPGPDDSWAGSRTHPFTVAFDLTAAPSGACRLVVDFANTHYGQPPQLEIGVNGRAKYGFTLPTGVGDESLRNPAVGRPYQLRLPFPARHLQAGRNTVSLTVVNGSWVLYDALRLETGVALPTSPVVEGLRAESTMLFKREGGALKQAIRVSFNNSGIEGPVEAVMEGGRAARCTLGAQPGSNADYFLVDPFTQPARLKLRLSASGSACDAAFEGRPERRWKVFVGPSSHTDIGYTDLQEKALDNHLRNTLTALQSCATDPGFKWNLEVAYHARVLAEKRPKELAALMARAREGRIGVQGLYLNMLTGLCSGEELVQVVTRAQELADANGFKVESANLSDVPSSIGTLPMMLRGAGVRYFAEAVNSQRGPVFKHAAPWFKQAPFWWEALDGSRVLAIFTEQYAQASTLGLTHSSGELARRLPGWLRQFDRKQYAPDAVYVYGAFSDNNVMSPHYAQVAHDWNAEWEYPHITIGRVDEFFRYVEREYGPKLPVLRGDFGSYWEDGAASSALETAMVRRARARLEEARRLHALAWLRGAEYPAWPLHEAWEQALFFDEHTWGAYCSISEPNSAQTKGQWQRKAAFAHQAVSRTEALRAASSSIPAAALDVRVFNSQSWPRDILASAVPPAGYGRLRDLRTGKLVAVQRSGGKLLFLASQASPLGYTTLRFERGESPVAPPVLRPGGDALHYSFAGWRIAVDPATGALSSLRDASGREWVDTGGGYGLNQFLYVLGGKGTRMVDQNAGDPKLDIRTHQAAMVEVTENGPVRAALRIHRTGAAPALDTTLLIDAAGRIDFVNVLHKPETLELEAGYFAFPFRLEQPRAARAWIELPYGVLEADREQLPGACRDWYSTGSFAAVSDGRATALLTTPHAPLVTLGEIFHGQWKAALGLHDGTLFGYAFNNYWDTNYRASQGGDMLFAYSLQLRRGGFDPAEATRFGWERLAAMADPAAAADGLTHGVEPATPAPVATRMPTLAVTGALLGGLDVKDGRLFVRLYNPTSQPAQATIALDRRILEARRADLAARPQGAALPIARGRSVTVTVPARGLATLRLSMVRAVTTGR